MTEKTGSLFDPNAADPGTADPGTADPGAADLGGGAPGGAPQRPDGVPEFVAAKYWTAENPVEAQARAYDEAVRRLSTKTEDLRSEIESALREELTPTLRAELAAERDVPEAPDAYALPEGVEITDEEGLAEFRRVAHEAGVSAAGFGRLAEMFAAATTVDVEAEIAKLGDGAHEMLGRVNPWLKRNVPSDLHPAVAHVMRTAEGAKLMDHLMGLSLRRAAPAAPTSTQTETRESLEAKLSEMRASSAYRDRRNPDHARAREDVRMMIERIGRL